MAAVPAVPPYRGRSFLVKRLLSGVVNGLGEIWGHKLRSLLTICCVMLGVASMVLTTGFMEGFFKGWEVSLQEQGGLEKISGSPRGVSERRCIIRLR